MPGFPSGTALRRIGKDNLPKPFLCPNDSQLPSQIRKIHEF